MLVHIGLADRLAYIKLEALGGVLHALKNNFIHGIIVLEFDKAEAALATSALLGHVLHMGHFAKLAEVLLNVFVLQTVLDAADKDLLHRLRALALANLVPRGGTLRLHLLSIDSVRPGILHGVHHAHVGKGDESKPSGPLGVPKLHDDRIHNLAVLLKVGLYPLVGGGVVESSHEQLPVRLLLLAVVVRDRLLPGRGPLGLHLLALDDVRPLVEARLRLVRVFERDESEAPGPLRVWEPHDHAVHQLSVLAKEGAEPVLRGAVVQPAQEQLPLLLRPRGHLKLTM